MNLPLPLDDPGDYEDPDDISEGERTSAPSEEQVGPGAFRGPGSTLIGGGGNGTSRGWGGGGGKLWPGVSWIGSGGVDASRIRVSLVRMAPSQLPWDVVLRSLDGAYGRAVTNDDAGWVGCLHESLRGRLPLEEYTSRFPLLGAEKGAEEEDEVLPVLWTPILLGGSRVCG